MLLAQSAHAEASVLLYLLAIPLWLVLWWGVDGYRLMSETKLLGLPFALSLLYLTANVAIILALGGDVGSASYEESRFAFIGGRAEISVQATASVLIIATLVYGLTIRKVPVDFVRFMVYSFISLLGVMAPLLWLPEGMPGAFYVLRHFQTVALNFGLFLCVSGIVVLLRDLLAHGEARVSFQQSDSRPARTTGAAVTNSTATHDGNDSAEVSSDAS